MGRLWEIDEDDWRAVLDTNLTGVWHTLKATVPTMIDAGRGGSIVTIGSVAGLKSLPGQAHYSAAKARRRRADRDGGARAGPVRHPGQFGASLGGGHRDES